MNRSHAAALLCAAACWAAPAGADQLNVSQIATGTDTPVDWAASAAQPQVVGASFSYFTMATAVIDPDKTVFFAPVPWSAAMNPAPAYPQLQRSKPTQPYDQGGASFSYDQPSYSRAGISMNAVAPEKKQVEAQSFRSGASAAAVSYRVRIDHTAAEALDYFLDLARPVVKRVAEPGYDLCCSGDSNGGTYTYHAPDSAVARAAVDVYADELPIWSSESAFMYPQDQYGTPWDKREWSWDHANGPGQTRLYLGRLAAGQSLTITLVARADARTVATDCGISKSSGPYGPPSYEVRCYELDQTIELSGGDNGAPVSFSVYSKAPPTAMAMNAKAPGSAR